VIGMDLNKDKLKNRDDIWKDNDECCADCHHPKSSHHIQERYDGEEYHGRCSVMGCNCSIFEG
jgi:hypothetical protein